MTDEERNEEGSEEPIEDLEAPAAAQEDVAGGRGKCDTPSCNPTVLCLGGTCKLTKTTCENYSGKIIVFDHEPT